MDTPTEPYRLYLIFADDCPTCQMTKPHVQAWAAKHPWIRFIEFNLEKQEWRSEEWEPRVTPTLVLLEPHKPRPLRHVLEHGQDEASIEKWVKRTCKSALTPSPSESR